MPPYSRNQAVLTANGLCLRPLPKTAYIISREYMRDIMASSRGRGSLRRGPPRFPFVVILSKGVSEKGVVFQRR